MQEVHHEYNDHVSKEHGKSSAIMPTSSNNKKRNTRHKQTLMVVVLIVFLSSVINIVRYSNLEAVLRVGIAATSLENSTTVEYQQNLLFLPVGDNSTTFVDIIPYNPQRRIVHIQRWKVWWKICTSSFASHWLSARTLSLETKSNKTSLFILEPNSPSA